MKLATLLPLLVVCVAVGESRSAPLDLKGKTLQAVFEELLPGLAGQGGQTAAQQQWQNICFQLGAPGNEAQRAETCTLMSAKLGGQTPAAAQVWLLKQLERIGRDECLPAVSALLADKDERIREAAVCCLANNPAPQATARLLAALPASSGKTRIGLLNALAQRADRTATDAIAKELAGADAAVAIAAARALGKLGTPEAARALAQARGQARGEVHLAVSDAYLLCADRHLRAGETREATAIYKALNKAEEPQPIRLAALQGVLKTASDEAGPMILEILGGDDAAARAIAIGQIENLNAAALKPLAANLDRLPPGSQVLVLGALAARADRSQLPVALKAARSNNEVIRRAGILALGALGDASVVPQLLETLYAGGNLAGPAGDSLAQIASDEVNQKLIAAMQDEKSPERIGALIDILQRRKASSAVPALLKAAQADDPTIRTRAFAGLRTLAGPGHLPEMVLALLKSKKGKEREQAEEAVVAVCAQVPEPEKRAEPILALLQDRAKDHKADLLPLLGRLGGFRSLQLVKEALASNEEYHYEAGLTSICNWPDPSVSEELLKLGQGAKQPEDRLRALQTVIRINTTQPVDRPGEQRLASLAVLKKAMALASRDEERRAILQGIGFVRHLDTLRYVLPYLDDKNLDQSACKAVVELAHSRTLREPNQPEFNKALDRVIGLCKDKGLVDRARQYREGR